LNELNCLAPVDLERYCLGQMSEPELGKTEEHLLWCQECITNAEARDRFLGTMRTAVRRLQSHAKPQSNDRSRVSKGPNGRG